MKLSPKAWNDLKHGLGLDMPINKKGSFGGSFGFEKGKSKPTKEVTNYPVQALASEVMSELITKNEGNLDPSLDLELDEKSSVEFQKTMADIVEKQLKEAWGPKPEVFSFSPKSVEFVGLDMSKHSDMNSPYSVVTVYNPLTGEPHQFAEMVNKKPAHSYMFGGVKVQTQNDPQTMAFNLRVDIPYGVLQFLTDKGMPMTHAIFKDECGASVQGQKPEPTLVYGVYRLLERLLIEEGIINEDEQDNEASD